MTLVDHSDVHYLIRGGAQIADALPEHEYQSAHIAGAIHLPLRRLLRDAPGVLERTRPVIVYCRDSL